MSVPVYRRNKSGMEFISIAEELLSYTSAMCAKFPTRRLYFGVMQAYELADKAANCVVEANGLNLFKYPLAREKCFVDALNYLAKLTIKFNLLKRYKSSLEGKHWEKWGVLVGQEVNLINNIMNSDEKRLKENKSNQIEGA